MRVPLEGHDRRGRPARRPAERARRDHRPPTRSRSSIGSRHAGHQVIEVSAFVSPKWVPQMADAAEVFAGITRRPGMRYTALVPNQQGLGTRHRRRRVRSRDLRRGVGNLQPPQHQSVDRRIARRPTPRCAPMPRRPACRVRGYLSTCFVCPFEGPDRAATRGRYVGAAARDRRLRSGDQRHDRRRALPVTSSASSKRVERKAPARIRSRCTSTTRAAPRSPTCSPASITA